MGKFINLQSKKFGFLTVIKRTIVKNNKIYWLCICKCGNESEHSGNDLRSGDSKSCGCYKKQIHKDLNFKHGMTNTNEFNIWKGILYRCINKNSKSYKNYGGRGITICDEWKNSFINFYDDLGPRPSKMHTIDRIDNNKGYYKDNCKWQIRSYQCINRRKFKKSKSKYLGVSFIKRSSKWVARIYKDNICYHLGTFTSELKAKNAYLEKRKELYK